MNVRRISLGPRARVGVFLWLGAAVTSIAAPVDIVGPAQSGQFGASVTVLANGNIVVTDPLFGANDIGAVYLYSPTGVLISTLTGNTTNDHVGEGGVVVLASGHYVVRSPSWDNTGASDAGAVTWGNAATGIGGTVSSANSLVGTHNDDHVGSGGITALVNGHYVVASPDWDNDSWQDEGAVTWGNGTTGTSGAVSGSNSLVGPAFGLLDHVGSGGVTALANGNYVVSSPDAYGRGAVTWRNGNGGSGAVVGDNNSLMGNFLSGDQIGSGGVIALGNGNYVVRSPLWDNVGAADAGAVTWGNGGSGVVGMVSSANSLVGTTAGDGVGKYGVIPLANGNYVVASCDWDNGGAQNAGAATWGDGAVGVKGDVSAANSLAGSTSGDFVCIVTALTNGNYVVVGLAWDNGLTQNVGSVTWRNGNVNGAGTVTPLNSLVGTSTNDYVGTGGVIALANGNYVACSVAWNNFVSAVTWGDGVLGTIGAVTNNNSFVGEAGGTVRLCYGGASALTNGNYVFISEEWDDPVTDDVGAVTWGGGAGLTSGKVSAANSLVGSSFSDFVGFDGKYSGVTVLANGHYVARSLIWDNGSATEAGAVTWGNGRVGSKGVVTPANSLVGGLTGDQVGSGTIRAFSDGNYAFASPKWSDAGFAQGGAVTVAWGGGETGGALNSMNSVFGTVPGSGASMVFDYDQGRHQLVVGRPASNIVSLLRLDTIFRSGFDAA